MRMDDRRSTGGRASRAIVGLCALAVLAGCSGGGSGSSGGRGTVLGSDSGNVGAPLERFAANIDRVTVLRDDGGRAWLYGNSSRTESFEFMFFGHEFRPKVLASGDLAPGTYTGLEVCYTNPSAWIGGSVHRATPGTGCITVAFPSPIEVGKGDNVAFRLDIDFASSFSRTASSSYEFKPRADATHFAAGEWQEIDAFRARLDDYDATIDRSSCTLLQPDGFGGWTDAGRAFVRFGPATNLFLENGVPVRFDRYSPESAFRSYRGRDFWFEGSIRHDGDVHASSAHLDTTRGGAFDNVSIEAIVTYDDGDDYTLRIARVLDDDGGRVPFDRTSIRARFADDDAPVYLFSTGESTTRHLLFPGARVRFTGHYSVGPFRRASDAPEDYDGEVGGGGSLPLSNGSKGLPGGGSGNLGTLMGDDSGGAVSGPVDFNGAGHPDFVVSRAGFPDQQASGIVANYDPWQGVVFAEVTGIQGFDSHFGSSRFFAFKVLPGAALTVDGLHPISADDIHEGDHFDFMGHPNLAEFGTTTAPLGLEEDDGSSTLPGETRRPEFFCRELKLKGREFTGEVVTFIDDIAWSFDLTGDGSDFGFPDPTTFRVFVPAYVYVTSEGTAGERAGLGRAGLFGLLAGASKVECRGFYDRNASFPTIVATRIQVETP